MLRASSPGRPSHQGSDLPRIARDPRRCRVRRRRAAVASCMHAHDGASRLLRRHRPRRVERQEAADRANARTALPPAVDDHARDPAGHGSTTRSCSPRPVERGRIDGAIVGWILGVSFIAFGVWTLFPDTADAPAEGRRWGPLLSLPRWATRGSSQRLPWACTRLPVPRTTLPLG